MLNEPSSARDMRPSLPVTVHEEPPEDETLYAVRMSVASVMYIDTVTYDDDLEPGFSQMVQTGQLTAKFSGRLRMDSEVAYEKLDSEFKKSGHLPIFREEKGKHVILAMHGRHTPRPRPWWPNLVLFVLTLLSVLLVGTTLALDDIPANSFAEAVQFLIVNLWRGLPFALSLLLILGGHELGHYFAARRHGLAVTLPYFIPLPFISLFGTLGAFIQLREPIRNRKVLFDVGASGPLVGLIFAVPILFIGLAQAQVGPPIPGGFYEGDSLLYAFAKIVTFGRFLPDGTVDVVVNSSQLAWAGWTGLLVSALNLIPIGQLDGGHIMFSLLGDRARRLYYPIMIVMIGLALVAQVWVLWVVLLLIFGRMYAAPLDLITPLDNRRRILGIVTMIIFLLIFIPAPLTQNEAPRRQRIPLQSAALLEDVQPVNHLSGK
jgi:Zn-dependent protease